MNRKEDGIQVLYDEWPEYELLDSGHYRKLERFGKWVISRSEPRAWWAPDLPEADWRKAVATCNVDGQWDFPQPIPSDWTLRYEGLKLLARFSPSSKHVGVFPEQSAHWRWIRAKGEAATQPGQLLNLFGYTGVASLVAADVGFEVTHIDASKPALYWAKQNQEMSGLQRAPIRWLLDDATKFLKREIRRERHYDAILLDPPAFGRGPKREVWRIEKNLIELLDLCRQVLSDHPLFVILTMYAVEASPIMVGNLLQDMMHRHEGVIQVGELALKHKHSGKNLPMSLFGRWETS